MLWYALCSMTYYDIHKLTYINLCILYMVNYSVTVCQSVVTSYMQVLVYI